MTNIEAIRIIGFLKETIDFDLLIEYTTALDMAIESLKRDEIGLTDTVKQIHDGVYKQGYEQGRADAIEECIEKINREHTHSAYHYDVYEAIMLLEQLKEKE